MPQLLHLPLAPNQLLRAIRQRLRPEAEPKTELLLWLRHSVAAAGGECPAMRDLLFFQPICSAVSLSDELGSNRREI
jgi:hypothetical protein